MAIKVYKFGGALLNKIEGFEQLKVIITNNINSSHSDKNSNNSKTKSSKKSEKNTIIVVVSALQKTTSKLSQAAKTAASDSEAKAMIFIDEIFDYHLDVVNKIICEDEHRKQIIAILEENKSLIAKIIRGISITKELTPRTKDLVLSFGEILASNIVAIFLSEAAENSKTFSDVALFNIRSVLITDSNYGAAVPNISATRAKIQELLLPGIKPNQVVVTQGFIASNKADEITTMGYESSNLTATILAGLTGADEFIIWSDTEGIRQADPKLFANKTPKLVERISYDFAEFLAYCGLKLIHPPTIKYLKLFDLEVIYKSGFVPDGEFSVIAKEGNGEKYRFLLYNENLTLYHRTTMNKFEINDFPQLAYFLHNPSSIVRISPGNHLHISSEASANIEKDLFACGFEKTDGISSATFIYSAESEAIQLAAESCNSEDKVYEIFINNTKQTAVILYKPATNNNLLKNALQFFERNFL